MDNVKKIVPIIITAIITAVIVWTLCKDDFSIDRAYLNEMQQELEEKEERIAELESDKICDIEQRLDDIEETIDEIYSEVDDIYMKIIPEEERQTTIDYSFTE